MSVIRLDVHPFLSPAEYLRRPPARPPFPLDRSETRIFRRGRHGLWWALRELALDRDAEALAPAYHHGSEIEALHQAGLGPRYYEATDTLEPDPDELEALLGPRVRALHLVHYLGFPQEAPRWRRWCDERGLVLIEDAAQAWLSSVAGQPVGSFGDIAFFSLYKTVALADGAALISRGVPPPVNGYRGIGAKELGRHHRSWLAQYLPWVTRVRLARHKDYDAAEDFALGDPSAPCSRTTPALLRRAPVAEARARRRANYDVLLRAFADHVAAPFRRLPDGACPLYFPIEVDDKACVVARLGERAVRGLTLWDVPHPSLPVEEFPRAAARRRRTVGLPIHQGLTRRQLDKVIIATRDAIAAA